MKLSIRFKLTLWYSLILIITSIAYTVLTNIIVTTQLQRDPHTMSLEIASAKAQLLEEQAEHGSPEDYLSFQDILDHVRQNDLQKIRTDSFLIFLALMALSFMGGYIITGRMLQPLRHINDATRTITADNLEINLKGVNAQDELGELIKNFNAMLQRLRTSFDLQKQFIANASHELKTPLTISQTNIEAALHDAQMSRTELEDYLRQSIAATTFMNQLIEDLLLLSVTDEQIQFTEINLAEIIEQAVKQLQPLAQHEHKVIVWQVKLKAAAVLPGNATLLQRAIMNGIENAIKYARTTITVTLGEKDQQVFVSIHDDGIGIPPQDIPKVTERFYRVDSSRSRASGGTGLGLAITKSILEHHHAHLAIASEVGRSTTVTITFP